MKIQNEMSSIRRRSILFSVGAVILLAVGIVAGHFLLPKIIDGDEHDHSGETGYYCPMHPHVQQNEPGVCPICQMDLVPKRNPDEMAGHEVGEERVHVTPRQRVIADVVTAEIDYRQLTVDIRAPANVEVNEATQKSVTAWYPGRIEKLYVDKTGQYVKRGAPLAEIYSPELIIAQREYLIALDTRDRQLLPMIDRLGEIESKENRGDQLVEASRERLKLLGMTDAQIESLEEKGKITRTTTVFSSASGIVMRRGVVEGAYVNEGTMLIEVVDLSSVWAIANVYESQANQIRPGMRMAVTGPSLNGERIEGRIDYVYPMIDPDSRTVQVRGVFINPGLRLKPGMYLTASIIKPPTDALAVPVGAVIRTGRRDLVYVDVGNQMFEAREVELGMKGDGYYQITGGDLHRGDKVVAEGGYLLDSERELKKGMGNGDRH
ncbi:MAG: efflux RND transporter periplasmic adaptor subunit [Chlorobi bacterium]|nr:efflux RND transporter periplasmic adaptor subunit [Chlorobiota bacterium]